MEDSGVGTFDSANLGAPHGESKNLVQWTRMHPYATALIATALLLVVGFFVVVRKTATGSDPSAQGAWDIGGTPLINPSYSGSVAVAPDRGADMIDKKVSDLPPYTYVPPTLPSSDTEDGGTTVGGFDFEGFMQQLASGSTPKGGAKTGVSGSTDTYSFIPTGLVSTSTPTQTRSDTQQKIYDYGNELGSYIQSYEERFASQSQVLKNQIEDRGNAQKGEGVKTIARALQEVGYGAMDMENVPEGLAAAHNALAKSYVDIGKKLLPIPDASSDEDLVAKINTYNAAADVYAKNYVALALLFASYGVKFDPNDPGSVFSFTNAAGF